MTHYRSSVSASTLLQCGRTPLHHADLTGHEVHTVEDAGLKGLENGDLLKAAAVVYEVLITVDQNIPSSSSR